MRITILLVALFATLTATAPAVVANDQGAWRFATRTFRAAPFPYVRGGVVQQSHHVGRRYGRRGRRLYVAPWRYDPDPHCVAPQCLPSYYRPVFPRINRVYPTLPLATVLDRLKRLNYEEFGSVVLAGPNYDIEALNRHGRVVRLIVNAKTGQIRRTLP